MEQIIQAFDQFMNNHGKYYQEFYVGIASNPIDRLTNGHGVDEGIPHIYWDTPLHTEVVRAIEKYFLNQGARGGGGGGDLNTQYVYAYKITSQTKQ